MKKTFVVILSFLMSIMACSCGSTADNSVESTETTEVTLTEAPETTAATTTEAPTTKEVTTTEPPTTLVSPNRKTNVRNMCWGDTKEIVKEVESSKLIDEDDEAILYDVEICGYSASMMLYFDRSYGLYEVNYIIPEDLGQQISLLLAEYENITAKISESYGTPEHNVHKLNSLADYCDSVAEALELGYVAITDEWYTSQTNIIGSITTPDYKTSIIIKFSSANFTAPEPDLGF